jgi:dephospho-CoA kinase
MTRRKLKIAVTGGIGAGKSEVCRIISESGYNVIHADDIAKDILRTDKGVKQQVVDLFGENSYADNDINRDYLSAVVFSDPDNVSKINSIIHPVTLVKINEMIEREFKIKDIVFVESALIFEASREDYYDYILLVVADEQKRIERILDNGHLSLKEITGRMKNQFSDDIKSKRADFIIYNNEGLDELANKTNFYINLFEALASQNN